MQRIMLGPEERIQEALRGGTVRLPDDLAHYLRDVLRMKPGDGLWLADGSGHEGVATLQTVSREEVSLTLDRNSWGESVREAKVRVTVGQGLPKGDKLEWVIQKGTEAGAFAFWPVAAARSVVTIEPKKEAKKVERWAKIAQEAAEQSHRARVPAVAVPLTVKQLISRFGEFDKVLVAAEALGHEADQGGNGLRTVLSSWRFADVAAGGKTSPDILVVVGPEGGWTDEEVRMMTEAGAVAVSLGRRILRTETAALVALSGIYYEFGEYGG